MIGFVIDKIGVTASPQDPNMAHRTVEQLRNGMKFSAQIVQLAESRQDVEAINASFEARDETLIPIRVYRPMGSGPRLPVVLFIHGGGWVFGDLDTYDSFARKICFESGFIVVGVEYRLAPEYPFPIGLNDAHDALKWIWNAPKLLSSFGADPKQIAIVGDSAGGNLAAVTSVLVKGQIPLKLQALLYPGIRLCDNVLSHYTSSRVQHSKGVILNTATLAFMRDLYLPNPEQDCADGRVSPILFSEHDLSSVAPAFIITASADPLMTEGLEYVAKLARSGVKVKHVHFNNTFHGFMSIPLCDHFEDSFSSLASALREAFGV